MEIARRNGWPRRWVISIYTHDDIAWSIAYDQLNPYIDSNVAQASIRQAFIGGSLSDHIFKPQVSDNVRQVAEEMARASAIRKANKIKAKMTK